MPICKRLILGLLVCAAGVGLSADVPQAWVNAVDTNVMEGVVLDRTNIVAVLNCSAAMESANLSSPSKITNVKSASLCGAEELSSHSKNISDNWFMSIPAAYGALAAALIALLGNCLVSVFKSGQDYKMAYRSRLAEFDAEIGGAMYQLLACCSMYGLKLSHDKELLTGETQRSDFERSLNKWREKADVQRKVLEECRYKARYVLYGIDEGLRTLTRIPGWLSHYSELPDEINALNESADKLRKELDAAILYSYKKGKAPSKSICKKVNIAAERVRRVFSSTKPDQCDCG